MRPSQRRARAAERSSGLAGWAAFLALAALAVAIGALVYGYESRPPLSLHARTARAYDVQGIDVSRHQGEIDWRAVAHSGIRFAWIKATEGGDHLDVAFRRNWILAQAAGVRRGAYHFVYWCRRAEDQAAWFVANVPAEPDALPPVLDVEWTPQSRSCPQKLERPATLAMMKTILAAMERATGKVPLIYAPVDFYADVMRGDVMRADAMQADLARYPLWVRNVEAMPTDGYDRRDGLIWQHSETGRVPGIVGDVDLDAFVGSLEDWRRWVREGTAAR